ncbi:hypothetical protein ACVNIS_24850 (plasmid) [Sphaerotilaceae bacterium SBD11-9]
MDHTAVIEKLRELAKSQENRSKTAVLREFLGEIEAARAKGVRHASIWKALSELGLEMTEATYFGTLRRLRRTQEKRVNSTPHTAEAPAPAVALPAPPTGNNSHSPAALNNILNSTPDLDALARAGKSPRRKA